MARVKASSSSDGRKPVRRALTPETREVQMTSYAMDLAEEQLRNGTASSQIISYFLKVGSTREKLELERLREENELLKAKTKAIASSEDTKELLEKALLAFTEYSGEGDADDEY